MLSDFWLAWGGWQQSYQPPRAAGMSLDMGYCLTAQTHPAAPGKGLALSFLANDRGFGWPLHIHVNKSQRGCRLWLRGLLRWKLLPAGGYSGAFAAVVLLPQQKSQRAVARTLAYSQSINYTLQHCLQPSSFWCNYLLAPWIPTCFQQKLYFSPYNSFVASLCPRDDDISPVAERFHYRQSAKSLGSLQDERCQLNISYIF